MRLVKATSPASMAVIVDPIISELHPMTGATQSQLNACVDPPDGCGRVFSPEEIDTWDRLTLKEASLSGLCKKCQDEVFGPCGEDCGH